MGDILDRLHYEANGVGGDVGYGQCESVDEAWSAFTAANKSIVVDLCYGISVTEMRCKTCCRMRSTLVVNPGELIVNAQN